MRDLVPLPGAPTASGWDMVFTRLARAVQRRVLGLVRELTGRLRAAGLDCDVQLRQTPRGVSTYLAVIGQRGLIFVVDMTLVDGMRVARQPGARLEVRLLDACGDAVATCWTSAPDGASTWHTELERILSRDQAGRCATAVHVLAMGHFGLASSTPRGDGRSAR